MGKLSLSNATTHHASSNEEQKANDATARKSHPISSDCCPFLMQNAHQVVIYETTGVSNSDSPTPSRYCHAVITPFMPSAVHQSSCCLNPGNFGRCPYYVEAMGEQKRQLELQARRQPILARLGKRIARLFAFGRTDHKKRKRVYYVI